MEYVEGGTLQPRQLAPGRWAVLPEKEIWRYVREVLQVGQRGGSFYWRGGGEGMRHGAGVQRTCTLACCC
jgi:hypothetical protein